VQRLELPDGTPELLLLRIGLRRVELEGERLQAGREQIAERRLGMPV
jgi:hypothetical protein